MSKDFKKYEYPDVRWLYNFIEFIMIILDKCVWNSLTFLRPNGKSTSKKESYFKFFKKNLIQKRYSFFIGCTS